MKKIFFLLILSFSLFSSGLYARDVIEVQPLFEYPVAPEDIVSLDQRCDYLVKNFWNGFNFKEKNAVNQYALNDAFQVYASAIRYASKKEVDASLDKLIKNLSGNPILLMQFGKAAEDCLYGPNAEFWIDEIYLQFLDAIIKNKKIQQNRKTKYINQANSLRNSAKGNKAPTFDFTNTEGDAKFYFPMSTPTLLIFGNPDNTDWRLSRLRMDSNFTFQEALDKGKINVLFIVPKDIDNWQNLVSNYNSKWTIGEATEISKIYDVRLTPSIYIIDSTGTITEKNVSPDAAVASILQMVN